MATPKRLLGALFPLVLPFAPVAACGDDAGEDEIGDDEIIDEGD